MRFEKNEVQKIAINFRFNVETIDEAPIDADHHFKTEIDCY